MDVTAFQKLACPLDGEPLTCSASAWACPNGHSFDLARNGYVNLLPVQAKRSRDPGDHKAMVAARQRFLNGGHYRPIAESVNRLILSRSTNDKEILSCLDAGCGEGYYLRALAAASSDQPLALVGVDISKWAVQAAARQENRPTWIVASNANLPVQSNSLDCLLCMFGFPVYDEFARVLHSQGVVLQVDAGIDHLQELRAIIYPVQKPAQARKIDVPKQFALLKSESVRYLLKLGSSAAIMDLLAMTPHFYRVKEEARERLAALGGLNLTIDVQLSLFELYLPAGHKGAPAAAGAL